jgi:hypothetical protein
MLLIQGTICHTIWKCGDKAEHVNIDGSSRGIVKIIRQMHDNTTGGTNQMYYIYIWIYICCP